MANLKVVWGMIKELTYVMNHRQRKQCMMAFCAMLVAAGFETLGIGVIIPFIISISQPTELLRNKYVRMVTDTFHIATTTELILIMAFSVIVIYVLKNVIILFSNYIQIRFRNNLERDMSVLMLDSYMKRPYTYFLEANSGDILRGVNSDISGVEQIVYGFKGRINRLGKRAREVFARRFEYANQAVGGIKEITVMQRRECFTRQYAEAQKWQQAAIPAINSPPEYPIK